MQETAVAPSPRNMACSKFVLVKRPVSPELLSSNQWPSRTGMTDTVTDICPKGKRQTLGATGGDTVSIQQHFLDGISSATGGATAPYEGTSSDLPGHRHRATLIFAY